MRNNKKLIITSLLSIIYSMFCIIGNSFMLSDSFAYVEKHLFINIIAYVILTIIFYIILNKLFNYLDNKKISLSKSKNKLKKIKNWKIYKLFDEHTFLFCLIFMIICWLPYIISFYPTIMPPDPSFQIRQYFKIPNKYSEYSIMIDPNVTITNHHPVIHTLLIGTCVKIGTLIDNVNLGLFLYSIIQIAIFSCTLAYTIKFLKDNKLNQIYLIIALLIYSFIPVFPFYAMTCVKDTIFCSFVILYGIALYKLIKSDDIKIKHILMILLLFILIILFRNNGIHTLVLSFPFLLFMKKNFKYKMKLLLMFIFILGFNFSYNSFILPYFRITPSSVREKLSIPFQQTARYVKEHQDDVSDHERRVIDKVLTYDTLAERYDSRISDPVKNGFNKYATDEDLKEYFKVWFNQFKRHPKTYFEATISGTYGYYYPMKTYWQIYHKFNNRIVKNGFDYHYNRLKLPRKVLKKIGKTYSETPIINFIVSIGFNFWLLLFMFAYLFYKNKYAELIYLAPSFVIFLVCLASPVNCYFRYSMPFVFAAMLNFGLFIKESVMNER